MNPEPIDWSTEPEFWAAVPVFIVDDVLKTARYYRDVLGFKIDENFSGPEWTMLWADQSQLYLSLRTEGENSNGQQVAICCPGIDDTYQRHRSNGANIVNDIEDKPWGLREYVVEDPNGYYLRFGSHIETQYKPWKQWKERQHTAD